ncbi:hypothetical protein HC229_09270, partial [Flavobacterium sp. D33]|nr:hypothetical protein [Flavobacterium selenitireducens]
MKRILLLFAFLSVQFMYSQGTTCQNAQPFCSGAQAYVYDNVDQTNNAPALGQMACLGSTPNPTWFYLQIDQGGDLVFTMIQNTSYDFNTGQFNGTNLDVDFIAWGPFNDPASMCALIDFAACSGCGSNTGGEIYPQDGVIDCSYDPSFTETLTINNAQPGQVYAVLITNYGQLDGYISLQQTNSGQPGAGSTDCSIVCPLTVTQPGIICASNPETTVTAISGASNAIYTWYDPNGNQLATGPGNQLTVDAPGTYSVHAIGQIPSGQTCEEQIKEFTVVEYTPPGYSDPTTISACNTPGPALFNLNSAIAQMGITPADFIIAYYHTQQEAIDVAPGALNPVNYPGTNGELVYISLESLDTGCVFVSSVTLVFDCQNDLNECDIDNDGVEDFDLSAQTPIVLGTLNPADYTVTYHNSQADANTGANPIAPDTAYPGSDAEPIYVHIHENANPGNVSTSSFTLHLIPTPVLAPVSNVVACDSFVLPTLTVGDYFTGSGGTGPISGPITTNQTVYVYAQSGTTPNCVAETSFTVTINATPATPVANDVTACDSYTLPALTG